MQRRIRFQAFIRWGVLTSVSLGLPAVAPAQQPNPAAAEKGKVIYQRYCSSCHGPNAKGDGPVAPDLKVRPPDLTRISKRNGGRFPFDLIIHVIDGRRSARAHGTSDMPVWGEVFERTAGTGSPSVESAVARLTHYLWLIQEKPRR